MDCTGSSLLRHTCATSRHSQLRTGLHPYRTALSEPASGSVRWRWSEYQCHTLIRHQPTGSVSLWPLLSQVTGQGTHSGGRAIPPLLCTRVCWDSRAALTLRQHRCAHSVHAAKYRMGHGAHYCQLVHHTSWYRAVHRCVPAALIHEFVR
jgi:hypothetical protein